MQLQRPLKRKTKKKLQLSEQPTLQSETFLEDIDKDNLQQVEISPMNFEYIVQPIESVSIYPSMPLEQYYSTNLDYNFDKLYCEPSAPSLDIIESDFKYITKVSSDVDLNEYVSIEETILESVYVNPLIEKYERDVINFRQYSLGGFNFPYYSNSYDEFYNQLQQYESSFNDTQRVKTVSKSLLNKSKNLLGRVWSLSRVTGKVESVSKEGWKVYHSFMNESAVYNTEIANELNLNLEYIRNCIQFDFPTASFNTKISRLWIQNYIDNSLSGKFGEFVIQCQNLKLHSHQQYIQFKPNNEKLIKMLDALFYYEQRKRVIYFLINFRIQMIVWN
jgi:hypothetical protein